MTAKTLARWSFVIAGALFAVFGYWGLYNLRLTINASHSLPQHAFIQWAWPQVLWKGAIMSVTPPQVFAAQFQGLYFTKEVVGLPGDAITHNAAGEVCVSERCYPLWLKDGKPFSAAIAPGVIPEGMVAAFGQSADSLDSRYGIVGLFPQSQIAAVGFGTDLVPHWKELKAWLDAR